MSKETPNWHCADRSYRVAVDVRGSSAADGPAPISVGVPLEAGLERLGVAAPPDPASCLVVPPGVGGADARAAVLFLAHSPHEPNHSLAFTVQPGESGTFWLYWNVLGDDASMSVATCSVGGGEPLLARDAPVNAGFSSRPFPVHWAPDGRTDLLVLGIASGRTFLYYTRTTGSSDGRRAAPLRPLRSGGEWISVSDAAPVVWDGNPALLMAMPGGELALVPVVDWAAGPVLGAARTVPGFETAEVSSLAVLPREQRWDLIVGLGSPGEIVLCLCRDRATSGAPVFAEPRPIETESAPEGALPMARRPMAAGGGVAAQPWSTAGGASGFTLYLGDGFEIMQTQTVGQDSSSDSVVMTDPRAVTDASGHPIGFRDSALQPASMPGGASPAPGLLIGSHTGVIYDSRNEGTLTNPVWARPTTVQHELCPLSSGNFAAPAAADWCDEGQLSLIVGDEYGRLIGYRNDGDAGAPIFSCCGPIRSDGGPVYFPGADLQGHDDFWGYTCPIAVDWNGDGRPDLIVAESRGYLTYFPNRCEAGPFHFGPGVLVELDGERLRSAWRVRPAIWPAAGRLDLVSSDEEGVARRFFDSGNRERPVFEGGQRLPLETGRQLRPFYEHNRNPWGGRTRYSAVDWDGRGLLDLFLTNNEGGELSSGLLRYHNLGTNDEPVFRRGEHLTASGWEVRLGSGHAVVPWFVDWFGDGRPDVLVGVDDGTVHLFRRSAFDVTDRPSCGTVQGRG